MAEADQSVGKPVNVHEAKTHFSKLLKRAHGGERIVLSKAGQPYAMLVPIDDQPRPPRKPGGLTGTLPPSFFDPLPDEEMIGLID